MGKRNSKKRISSSIAALMLMSSIFSTPTHALGTPRSYENYKNLKNIDISSKLSQEQIDQINQIVNEAVKIGLKPQGGKEFLNENSKELPEIQPDEKVRFIVELKNDAIVESIGYTGSKEELMKAATNESMVQQILEAQEKVIDQVLSLDNEIKVYNRYTTLINGFSIEAKYEELDKIKGLPNVANVTLVEKYLPQMNTATNMVTEAEKLWKELGYDGEGMVVSIVDTGIDWEHQDMKLSDDTNPRLTEEYINQVKGTLIGSNGKYFNEKIPYGFNYTSDNREDGTVYPGNEQQEIRHMNGSSPHGSHVAGIVGANSQNPDAIANNKGIKGVAPETQLLAMKVFTNDPTDPYAYSDDVIAAIEDSIKLGADVVNMSLGSDAGFQSVEATPHTKAIRKATEHGVMVVVSAGNAAYSIDPYMIDWIKDTGLVGSPGLTNEALQVASFENERVVTQALTVNVNGDRTKSAFQPTESTTNERLKRLEGVGMVYCDIGGVPENFPPEVNGKIAVVMRGANFTDSQKCAQEAGAVGLIVFNHTGGGEGLVNMAEYSDLNIPALFIGNTAGQKIVSNIETARTEFNGEVIAIANPSVGKMSSFTSWGPTPNLDFKPEITGVGGNIWSTVGSGQHANMSGTSMASPYVAGFMAIYMQALKDNGLQFNNDEQRTNFIKANAINTAKVIDEITPVGKTFPVSPRRQGAGLINIDDMLKNKVTATYQGEATAALKEIGLTTYMPIKLTNHGNETVYYIPELLNNEVYSQQELANVYEGMMFNLPIDGASVTFEYEPTYIQVTTDSAIKVISEKEFNEAADKESVKEVLAVTTGSSITVDARLNLPQGTKAEKFVEGFLKFNPINTATTNTPEIGTPFMGFYGDWNISAIFDAPRYTDETFFGFTGLGYEEDGGIYFLSNNPDEYAINPYMQGGKNHAMPIVSLLRNARYMTMRIEDEEGNVVSTYPMKEYYRKNYTDAKVKYKILREFMWDGRNDEGQVVEDGQYYYVLKAKIDYPGKDWQELRMPIKVDSEAPIVFVDNQVDYVEEAKTNISFDMYDSSGLLGVFVGIENLITGERNLITNEDGSLKLFKESELKSESGKYELEVGLPYKYNRIFIYPLDVVGVVQEEIPATKVAINTKFDDIQNKLTITSPKPNKLHGENQDVIVKYSYDGEEKVTYELELSVFGLQFGKTFKTEESEYNFGTLPEGTHNIIVKAMEGDKVIGVEAVQIEVGQAESNFIISDLTNKDYFLKGELAKITIKVENVLDKPQDAALIVGLFDKEGRMVNIVAVEQNVTGGDIVNLNAYVKLPSTGEYELKAFVWDSLDKANPLSNVLIYKVQ